MTFPSSAAGQAPFAAPLASASDAPPRPATDGPLGLIELLLRSPSVFLAQVRAGASLDVVRALLVTIAAGGGLFGVVVGTHRGGVQVLYCAVKLPLVLLVTLVISVPTFLAAARALGIQMPPRAVITLSLGACARFSLVLAGVAPVVWLLEGLLSYHSVALCITAAAGLAGLSAVALLVRGLRGAPGQGALAGAVFAAVYAIVGAQTVWLARPFLVRPRTEHVPFLRPLEGDLLGSIRSSARSAAGIYDRGEGGPRDRVETGRGGAEREAPPRGRQEEEEP